MGNNMIPCVCRYLKTYDTIQSVSCSNMIIFYRSITNGFTFFQLTSTKTLLLWRSWPLNNSQDWGQQRPRLLLFRGCHNHHLQTMKLPLRAQFMRTLIACAPTEVIRQICNKSHHNSLLWPQVASTKITITSVEAHLPETRAQIVKSVLKEPQRG